MILVITFLFVFLSCLPLLHSATYDGNSYMPICKESFRCKDIGPFSYPFYKISDKSNNTGCGLIGVSCNPKGDRVQFGGGSYEITGKFSHNSSSLLVRNRTFEKLVINQSCEALTNNFTSPNPLLFSISIKPVITLFKCSKSPNYTSFQQPIYSNYSLCKVHNFYFRNSITNATVPTDLPHTCQVIQLPMTESAENNIFSLLSSNFYISFNLSDTCKECRKNGTHCHSNNGHLQCLDVKMDTCRKCHKNDSHCQSNNGHLQCLDVKTATGKTRGHALILGLIVGSAFVFMLFFVIFIICHRCKGSSFSYASSKNRSSDLEDSRFFGVPIFSYSDLKDATQNFDTSKEIGDGGFGAVYYGKLQDGREIAVKRLYDHNYKRVQHFMNEVEILTRLRHPNLVVLYGCTSKQSRELLLVYEYIPNGTVADHLHGEPANQSVLTWPLRMNIAIETAGALVYLHASDIIHRDVKTNNILLDNNFSVKVADFGLSRLLPNNVTYVSTAPQGTPGYLDPQYHQRYQLTDKSDVYSFGVVLIELISSMVAVDLRRSQEEISLANLALNKIQGHAIEQLIDPVLLSDSNSETMNMITLVAELAFRCLQFDSEMRPTMNEVLDVLTNLQAEGSTDPNDDSSCDLKYVNPPPSSENSDAVVMLKDFLRSPISVTSEWKSVNSASTTISSNGEKLPVKNRISK